MSESHVVSAILLQIGSRPDVRLWRSQPLVAHDRAGRKIRALPKGHPDLTGLLRLPGGWCAPLFVEAKSDDGRLSPEQRQWKAILESWGACYVTARSVADVERAIESYVAAHRARLQSIR